MIAIRPSAERGHFRADWLDSRHTFSFDTYYDPNHMGFRALRVINEDVVQPANGFPLHRHENMEVVTVVLSGELRHEDDLGHGAVIGPGEVQRFSAGTGIRHSEFNPSDSRAVHLLQIWILPEHKGLTPGYEQKSFKEERGLQLIGSRDGRNGSVTIHQDVALYRGLLDAEEQLNHRLAAGRHAWLQVMSGILQLDGHTLQGGDGAAVSDEREISLAAAKEATFLLFDLA